jgi:hypothetical protein
MLAVLSLSIAATSQASIIASDTDLGDVTSAIINHVFTATDGTEPYFWSDLTSTVGSPAVAEHSPPMAVSNGIRLVRRAPASIRLKQR